MIQQQLKNQDISEVLFVNNRQMLIDIYSNENEWIELKNLEQLLKPMYEATKLLSTSKHPTIGDMCLAFLEMFNMLSNFIKYNSQKEVAELIYKKLISYWKLALDETFILSAVFDLRSKLTSFTVEQLDNVKQKLQTIFAIYQQTNNHLLHLSQQHSNQQPLSHLYFQNILNEYNKIQIDENNLNTVIGKHYRN
ncbi:317_t:CDS:2 [Racocetra fulgida]|uniref:317_t:CDS:1 n=1 Tax=Racocetra fulgida TaxID=60492 RepID=A0A9N8VQK1_9GLOM|nr:317_t:CDS:2 [Racocetra fulgida]